MIRVLIADDENIILKGICGSVVWAELGMEVVATASDGEAALAAIERHDPQLCLLDIRMPKVDGLAVAKAYLASHPHGLVILISGYDEFNYAQQAVNAGIFAYILKPVDETELCDTVARAGLRIQAELQRSLHLQQGDHLIEKNKSSIQSALLCNFISGNISSDVVGDSMRMHDIHLTAPIWVQVFRLRPFSPQSLPGNAASSATSQAIMEAKQGTYLIQVAEDSFCMLASSRAVDVAAPRIPRALEPLLPPNEPVIVAEEEALSLREVSQVYLSLYAKVQKSAQLPQILQFLLYDVYLHFDDPTLRLQHIAGRYSITASYLSRLFGQRIGVPFTWYLREYRIRQSMRLLSNPNDSIVQIAERTGFNSQHYFAEAFRQVTGISPSAWRKKRASLT